MKQLLLLTLLCVSLQTFGQKLTGLVTDKNTGLPVSGAIVALGPSKTFTDNEGRFELNINHVNDTLRVSSFTYLPYLGVVSNITAYVKVNLLPKLNLLNEVIIRSGRNFKQDSISNRMAYTKQFNYTGPKLKDAFMGSQNPGRAYGQMVTINPLLLVAALAKKSTPQYKLQQRLISDEQDDYVSRRFNKAVIKQLTHLQGDILSSFIVRYKPAYPEIKKLSDYEIQVYIKTNFKSFAEAGYPVSNPFMLAGSDSSKK